MKTSTKLLIALSALLPISMMAYGYLLKQQFDAGNFFQNIFIMNPEYTFKKLPPFKHLVIDGDIYTVTQSSFSHNNSTIGKPSESRKLDKRWATPVEIISSNKPTGYSVQTKYEDIVKTKIQNDTLYISLFKLNGKDLNNFQEGSPLISIRNNHLNSVNLYSGFYTIRQLNAQSFTAKVKDANLVITNVKFHNLNVFADNSELLNIESSTIGAFQYSLLNSTRLSLGNNKIDSFHSLNTDNSSEISVQGSASMMKKFLALMSQSK